MINKESRLTISVWANKLLLAGCLLLANVLFIKTIFYSNKSIRPDAINSVRSVLIRKVLLKSVIDGYEKERVIAMLEKEATKPQNENVKLKIDDNVIVFGEIKFLFENGKLTDIEWRV